MLGYPVEGGLDAWVVAANARIDHAFQPGIGHRAVAAESAGRCFAGLAESTGGWGVIEASVGFLAANGVVLYSVSRFWHRETKISCPLHRFVLRPSAPGGKGVDQEAGVRQVRPLVLSVTGAAIVVRLELLAFVLVPLELFDVALRIGQQLVVAPIVIGGGKTHDRQARLVVAVQRIFLRDAAVGLDESLQVAEALGDQRVLRAEAILQQARRHDGGDTRTGIGGIGTVGRLAGRLEERDRPVQTLLVDAGRVFRGGWGDQE